MSNIMRGHRSSFAMPVSPDDSSPNIALATSPYCFAFDTDNVPYVLDTGANKMIVNDPKLLKNFQVSQGGVKGVG